MSKIAKIVSYKLCRKVPWLCIDELTQAAFAEMWAERWRYEARGATLETFLWRVAARTAAREARARIAPVSGDLWRPAALKGLAAAELEEVEDVGDEELIERIDRIRKVRTRLTTILPRQDAVFVLAVVGFEMPADEAAHAFDMTPHAVHQRGYRLRNVLRRDPELRRLWREQ